MSPVRRRLLRFGLLAAIVAAAVAVIHALAAPASVPAPSPQTAHPGTWPSVVLPLSAYEPDDDQRDLLRRAEQALITGCLSRFGLSRDIPPAVGPGYPAVLREISYLDPTQAQAGGFHTPTGTPSAAGTPPAPSTQAVLIGWQRRSEPGAPPMAVGIPVLQEFSGRPVPANGCQGQAADEMAAGAPALPVPPEVRCAYACGDLSSMLAANEIARLRQLALDRLADDPAYRALAADWSQCMAAEGLRYATPQQAWSDSRWSGERPSQGEIDVAVRYAGCQRTVGYLERVVRLETAQEQRVVDANRTELDRIAANLAVRLNNAHAVLYRAGPGA